jgi:ABC-type transporter Mla maintaining outer membrane lipid asymmetry ATPase subunit MlaF
MQLVFQSGALFDSLSVWENVAFPLNDVGDRDEEIDGKVQEYLKLVEIEDVADLMPSELSTGMKRAVAIARALAAQPKAILYDEPTTMVDPIMSQTINNLIQKMQHQVGLTQMVVTHDIANCAEKVADHVALLHEGRFVFIGTMDELYASDHPVVREFVEEDLIRFEKAKELVGILILLFCHDHQTALRTKSHLILSGRKPVCSRPIFRKRSRIDDAAVNRRFESGTLENR